ncbi:hypothetical protein GCM10008018_04430 [Paenibacillus marchantiophytorum]|uniref:Uncharacterized protein n=1 Tax=Paenibacillus marchantiophytorum TaxID=1619310 RepID=A0ABQ2BNK8_9BACL|nr:hypothetical protein GCM10008018_04430 [Paenibacillus marchantiophytorum]
MLIDWKMATLEVVRSQGASNELYDAYRLENCYFGDLMNGVGATRHFIGLIVIICLQ